MKKKQVQKELNRLGFDVEIHDRPLTPDLPEGLMAVDNMKLTLTPEKAEELAERDRIRRESPEPTGTLMPSNGSQTILEMINADKPRDYAPSDIIRFITTYVTEGTYKAVERTYGVPYTTLQTWATRYSWWNEAISWIKNTTDTELEADMTAIVRKTTKALIDRIDNGDVGVHQGQVVQFENEDGEPVDSRVPLSSDQLARIGAIWFDKRQIARGMDVASRTMHQQSLEDKMHAIINKMNEVANEQFQGVVQRRDQIPTGD